MKTTKLLAGSPAHEIDEIPDLATCMRHVVELERADAAIDAEIGEVAATAGQHYQTIAQGGEIPRDVQEAITRVQGKGIAIRAALAEAKRVLALSQDREVKAATIESQDKADAIARRFEALGVKMETAADELCRLLNLTWQLGQEATTTFRAVGRLDNTLTETGYIASSEITDLASADQLQSMVERHFHATLGFWRSDTLMVARANPRLAQSLAGMAQSLRNSTSFLLDLGVDVTDDEKRSIRHFMARKAHAVSEAGPGEFAH